MVRRDLHDFVTLCPSVHGASVFQKHQHFRLRRAKRPRALGGEAPAGLRRKAALWIRLLSKHQRGSCVLLGVYDLW